MRPKQNHAGTHVKHDLGCRLDSIVVEVKLYATMPGKQIRHSLIKHSIVSY